MQVLSGAIGKERVHYEAPGAVRLKKEMDNGRKQVPLRRLSRAACELLSRDHVGHLPFIEPARGIQRTA